MDTIQKPSSSLQKIGMIGGLSATLLSILAIKYPDRLVFTEYRGIPSFSGSVLVGTTPSIIKNKHKLQELILENLEKIDGMTMLCHGLLMHKSILTVDPRNIEHFLKNNFENYVKGPLLNEASSDLLGHGIFNANGEVWRYQRKTASQIFNVKNFRDHFTQIFVEHINYMVVNIFDIAMKNGTSVDFHDIMFKFTLDSFVKLGFGVDLHALSTKGKVPFASSFDIVQQNAYIRFTNPYHKWTEKFTDFLFPWNVTIGQHINIIDGFAYEVIKKRRQEIQQGEQFNDLLSRFMETENEKGELLNDTELRDVVLNMVIAGRDTTAQALSWTFYSLMEQPRVEEKLLKEINEYIPDGLEKDPAALYEAIKNMKYAHAVFYEVLRLYPSVPNNQKYALNDDIWPDGTHIKKGDYVLWSTWAMGRSFKIWGPDAKQFRPERWLNKDGELNREPQGQNLATLEALVTITSLLKRYRFSLMPNQLITYQISLTLPMKHGLKVFVHQRNQ
ncbi:cytochrome P450 [Cunninghamella echinulata]|nr:cytochrome P450 [Cunninghamella echinulata]